MPIIHVNMLAGRTAAQKQQLAQGICAAVSAAIGVQPEAIRVLIHEVEPGHWFAGGVPLPAPHADATA